MLNNFVYILLLIMIIMINLLFFLYVTYNMKKENNHAKFRYLRKFSTENCFTHSDIYLKNAEV